MVETPSSPSRAPSGFRNLPHRYALFSPRMVFTTMTAKEASLGPYAHPTTGKPMHLFSLDDSMYYLPFKNDHGPLNLCFTFEACVRIHEKMNSKDHCRRALCLYTSPEPEPKSNLALIAALFNLIVERSDPWDAFQPIAHMELLPFRDAGNGMNEFGLSVQDVLYGVWKAGHNDLLQLQEFDAEEYRYYEKVENGDLNIFGNFIPFASPIDPEYSGCVQAGFEYSAAQKRMSKSCFEKVKAKFVEEDVGLVVRLNEKLYDRAEFLNLGMDHLDLYFDDGTNPTDEIVREFIKRVDYVIEVQKKKVAVHCKAGLGRTGVLIGAYLIYKYQFTASEAIGFMRIVRPGMVVGPQQRYMQLSQMKWAGWAAVDAALASVKEAETTSLPTPPTELSQVEELLSKDKSRPLTPTRRVPSLLMADAVGQPRKGPDGQRVVVESASQDPLATPTQKVKVAAPSSPSERHNQDSASRGQKRGAGRAPVSIRAPAIPQPEFKPSPALVRSVSAASSASSTSELDQRATKRRPGDALPLPKSGLSSPPQSRETTPFDEFDTFPMSESDPPPSTPPRSSSTVAALTPNSPSCDLSRQRSLIPRRAATPFREPRPTTRSRGSASDSEVAGMGSPKSKPSPRRIPASPRVWNSLTVAGVHTSSA